MGWLILASACIVVLVVLAFARANRTFKDIVDS